MEQNEKSLVARIMLVITTPKLADKTSRLLMDSEVAIHYALNAVGTAPSEIMDILGLGSPERSVLISMLPKGHAEDTLRRLRRELLFGVPGNGIAFTLPMSGASNMMLKMLRKIDDDSSQSTERKDEFIMSDTKRVMIAAVVNHGYSEEVMSAAREMGAKGGTVIHARGVANEVAVSFWGLGLQEEKETVLIITDTESKLGIMKAISEKCGMHSDAKGMVVSMPIDSFIGPDSFR